MEVGRPTVVTDEVLRKLEAAFALGCTDLEACVFADISKTALYDYQKSHPEFAERKEFLKEKPFLKARTTIIESLSDPNHAFKFMERKKKAEFGNNIEITGSLTISDVLDNLEKDGSTLERQELED